MEAHEQQQQQQRGLGVWTLRAVKVVAYFTSCLRNFLLVASFVRSRVPRPSDGIKFNACSQRNKFDSSLITRIPFFFDFLPRKSRTRILSNFSTKIENFSLERDNDKFSVFTLEFFQIRICSRYARSHRYRASLSTRSRLRSSFFFLFSG